MIEMVDRVCGPKWKYIATAISKTAPWSANKKKSSPSHPALHIRCIQRRPSAQIEVEMRPINKSIAHFQGFDRPLACKKGEMAFCCVGTAALSLARLKGRGLQSGKRASQVRRLVDADGNDVWERV